jgi:hypothetical protein
MQVNTMLCAVQLCELHYQELYAAADRERRVRGASVMMSCQQLPLSCLRDRLTAIRTRVLGPQRQSRTADHVRLSPSLTTGGGTGNG